MSSPFDQEAPVKAPKKTKVMSSSALSDVLKSSGAAAVVSEEAKASESLAAEPAITTKIRANIMKIVQINMMVKKSAVISKIEESMFPQLKEATDEDANSVYGTINLTIATMLHEDDLQEFKFLNSEGKIVDSMLVKAGLQLEGAMQIEEDLPELAELDEVAMLESDGATMEDDLDTEEARDDLGDIETLHSQSAHHLLASHIEGWCVTYQKDGKALAQTPDNAAGALSLYSRMSEESGSNAQIWGMIPIDVEVRLNFSNIVSDSLSTSGPGFDEPETVGQAVATGTIDVSALPTDEDSASSAPAPATLLDNQA